MGQASKEAKLRYYEKNRDKIASRKRAHYLANRQKYLTIERDRQYKARYGITIQDYDRMLEEQGGKCFICESTEAGKVGQCFAVDHCHTTGKVRGLLCIKCNSRLGWFERNQANVKKYLKEQTDD